MLVLIRFFPFFSCHTTYELLDMWISFARGLRWMEKTSSYKWENVNSSVEFNNLLFLLFLLSVSFCLRRKYRNNLFAIILVHVNVLLCVFLSLRLASVFIHKFEWILFLLSWTPRALIQFCTAASRANELKTQTSKRFIKAREERVQQQKLEIKSYKKYRKRQ